MSESFSVRWAASTLKAAGLGAVLLGALALAVIGWGVVSVAGVLLGPSPKALTSNTIDKEQAAKRATQFDGYLAQINGRSLLITPAPPSKDEPAPPVDETPKDPPRPSVYGGPALTAMMLDSAWFSDGSRLVAGGEGKGELKVLGLNPPWDVKVEWRGVEFDVPLFDRNKVVFKESSSSAAPAPSPHESATPAPGTPVRIPDSGPVDHIKIVPPATPPTSPNADAPAAPATPPPASPATVDPK